VIAQGTSTLDQSVGTGKELAVIAAVVIGGTSIMGGRGSVLGTFLGALLVQTVTSGVTQLGWKSQLSDLFVGIFIIVAVGTDLLRERARRSA
jgi:ribose transport system permease protein